MVRLISMAVLTAVVISGALAAIGFAIATYLIGPKPVLYRSADLSFELPKGWACVLEGTEWVCQLKKGKLRRAAIIIFALKERGVSKDTLTAYEAHLRNARQFNAPDGTAVTSKVEYVRRLRRGSQEWVDSRQFQSELPGFHTRYLATTTSRLGILVTYSVSHEFVTEVEPELQRAFDSLKLLQRG